MCGGGGSSPEPAPKQEPVKPTPAPTPAPVPEPTPAPTPAPTAPEAAAPSAPTAAGGLKKGRAVQSIKQGLMSTVRSSQKGAAAGRPVLRQRARNAATSMFDKSTKEFLGQ